MFVYCKYFLSDKNTIQYLAKTLSEINELALVLFYENISVFLDSENVLGKIVLLQILFSQYGKLFLSYFFFFVYLIRNFLPIFNPVGNKINSTSLGSSI